MTSQPAVPPGSPADSPADQPLDQPLDLVVAGLVRTAPGRWVPGEVWCDAGVVVAVVEGGSDRPARRRMSYPGSYLVPGGVDVHVHAYSASTEGLLAVTRSAAAGGVTTVVEMPYDEAAPVNDAARVAAKIAVVEREAVVDVGLLGTLAPDGGWRETAAMVDAGVVGFKLSLYHTHPVRFPRIGHLDMLASMAEIRAAGSTLCVHAEDDEIVRGLAADPSRATSDGWQAHLASRPPVAETLGTVTALELAAEQGVRVHICHASLPRVVDLVTWYREQGVDASAETCPHYLVFSEDDMAEQGARLKINPPMRPRAAVNGLWHRLGAGEVAVVSSDHAPWAVAQKTRTPFLANASGAPGIETLLPATLGEALHRDPSGRLFDAALDALTIGPARRYGLDARKGSLEAGKDADLVVLTPDPGTPLDEATLHSNAGWSPFHGRALGARVELTVNRGAVVWDAATGAVGPAGAGRLLTRPR